MSLRDFNEPSEPVALHTDPSGNSAGLAGFHTTNPEEREPSNTPKIVGALAVALMVGVAGIGLYAYSGSSQQAKPVVADNSLPQPAAAAPIAPPAAPAQQAANTPADTSAPAPAAATDNSTPAPAPVKEAAAKPIRHHASDSNATDSKTASNASDASSVRMNADSTQSTQAPAQQAAVQAPAQQAAATPLPPAPQPSPSDVASNNTQPNQGVQSAAPAPDATAQSNAAPQQPAQQAPAQQQAAPVEQTGTPPAQ